MITLGLDTGTSSIKALLIGFGNPCVFEKPYSTSDTLKNAPGGLTCDRFISAVKEILFDINIYCNLENVESIGLSGQTGTYLTVSDITARENIETSSIWLPWYEPGREQYLERILNNFSSDQWIRSIAMVHPRLASYPLPAILYLQDKYPGIFKTGTYLLQPKDYLCGLFTGSFMSDTGSWRGLTNAVSGSFSEELLEYAGITCDNLPIISDRGQIDKKGASLTGFKPGTPVAVGYNDFYSALIGIGINKPGDCFDITGTSEHFGIMVKDRIDTTLIASPYMTGYVHYGVTASSGKTLDVARRLFGECDPEVPIHAPIFLPYLAGERMPVSDTDARGMMIGLNEHTDRDAMKYSMTEGVVFSLYDIYVSLGQPDIQQINCTGGASINPLLNRLKASIFNVPAVTDELTCGSALGAVKSAGGYLDRKNIIIEPDLFLNEFLLSRFEIYKRMYSAWKEMTAGIDTVEIFG